MFVFLRIPDGTSGVLQEREKLQDKDRHQMPWGAYVVRERNQSKMEWKKNTSRRKKAGAKR
jgi:hypothetical protein